MKVLIKLIFFLIINLTVSKDIKDLRLNRNNMLNLSLLYDYKIKFMINNDNRYPSFPFYFFIATELDSIPFDITYSFGGENITSKNISIYYEERKGKFNCYFFKLEKPKEDIEFIDFNISNIKGEYALIVNSMFEELNSNIVKIKNSSEPQSIEIHKDIPIFILFNIQIFKYPSYQLTVPSFGVFKKNLFYGGLIEEINEISILDRTVHFVENSYIVYDNKTYEFYAYDLIYQTWMRDKKSSYIILQPLVDTNITFHLENATNVLNIDEKEYSIPQNFYINFMTKQYGVKINFKNYYQNLFYFTISKEEYYKYYYSYKSRNQTDTSYPIDLKNVNCKEKKSYVYCEANRTYEDQDCFYFIYEGKTEGHNALFFSTTFFDEYNYNILNIHTSYEFKLNKTNPHYNAVIGNFDSYEDTHLELEIEFPENEINEENNIKNIDITVQINNRNVKDYLQFTFENKAVSLKDNFSTVNKYYYLYRQINLFSGPKSLFFFIYHRGKNPNCNVKLTSLKESPRKYDNYLVIKMNQEKIFTHHYNYDIFFLSVNLTSVSFLTNDNIHIIFKSNKNTFKDNKVYYYYSSSKNFNYDINGDYSICQTKIKNDDENNTILSCLISKTSNNPLHFIIYLNQLYDINVKTEILNIAHFNDTFSCNKGRKYIISNDASISDNYYIFKSSNKNFNIEDIRFNFINNSEELSEEDFPILDSKEVQTSEDKRFYIKIKNIENKKLIQFKTNIIEIPFQIIKTNFDESKTIFIYENIKQKEFDVIENEPFLFVLRYKDSTDKVFFKFTSYFNNTYFNYKKYNQSTKEFQCFSNLLMNDLGENAFKIFHAENKMILYKEIPKSSYSYVNNYISFILNSTISGKIKFEILQNFNDFYDIKINDIYQYKLQKGVNYITSNLREFNRYYFIIKHKNSIINDNIEIYLSNSSFKDYQNYLYNCTLDIKNDNITTYYFVNFDEIHSFIIFANSDSDINIRQSDINENNVEKLRNINETMIEIQNTNKIFLIELNPENYKYYLKMIVDSKYKNQLKSKYYIEYKDINNIVDFSDRDKNNIKLSKIIEFENKTEYYLETNTFWNNLFQTAVFIFKYYNGNHTLDIKLSLSENEFYSYNSLNLNISENNTFLVNNKVFLLNLYTEYFKLGDLILYEFKGNNYTFNSTKVFIQSSSDNQTTNYIIYNNCTNFVGKNETFLYCNFTKTSNDSFNLMLLLNEGNEIIIRNINHKEEEKDNPSDKPEEQTTDDKNKKLKYFYYIGLPIIGVILIAIIIILIIKFCIKKKNIIEELPSASSSLLKELNNN